MSFDQSTFDDTFGFGIDTAVDIFICIQMLSECVRDLSTCSIFSNILFCEKQATFVMCLYQNGGKTHQKILLIQNILVLESKI